MQHIVRHQVVGHEKQGQVSNGFGRRRHFDDIAQQLVYVSVGIADFRPALVEAQRAGLFKQVRILAAGHFVPVQVGAGRQ